MQHRPAAQKKRPKTKKCLGFCIVQCCLGRTGVSDKTISEAEHLLVMLMFIFNLIFMVAYRIVSYRVGDWEGVKKGDVRLHLGL